MATSDYPRAYADMPRALQARYRGGDWRHSGIYALRHLPSGLEYVGAAACVQQRLRQHVVPNSFWRQALERLVGEEVLLSDVLPLFLERVDPWRLKEAEERHIAARRPALNLQPKSHYSGRRATLPKAMADPLTLGEPPSCPSDGELKAVSTLQALEGIRRANAEWKAELRDTRRQLEEVLTARLLAECKKAAAKVWDEQSRRLGFPDLAGGYEHASALGAWRRLDC